MSLLMDALKKAEQAKRRAEAGGAGTAAEKYAAELELAPLENKASTPGIHLDELQLEALDDQFEAPPASKFRNEIPRRTAAAGPPSAAEPTTEERAAARNVFEAKQPKRGGKLFAVVVGALTLIAIAAIGIYFWLQLAQPGSALIAQNAPLVATRPLSAAPTPSKAIATATPLASTERKPKAAMRSKATEAPLLPSADGEAPIRVNSSRLQVNPALARAYDAFVAGDLAAAAHDYGAVLQSDSRNTDALLGLAAVHLRQGQPALAEDLYMRTLEADPKNALAQAGLIALHNQGDPIQAETHLQTLIAAQPDLPPLHFVLGNVYARQGRWNEAQRAYFKAYSGDNANPDYLFNLAVSLDRMRQPKLAVQYYNQALAAAAGRQFSFDRAQLSARLHDLQQ